MCVRVTGVMVRVIVSLLVNPVLYNLSLQPLSSPLSVLLSVCMDVFYRVNKMSHTVSLIVSSEITEEKAKTEIMSTHSTRCKARTALELTFVLYQVQWIVMPYV